ncbi:MAG TPA: hypothetical protein EYQ64_04985 [Gemmatimonadetes bacterium]|nr:hypothetical protein [Gemmatimonadota bacterium]
MRRFLLAASILLLSTQSVSAQLSYTRGQNVAPGYEGWEENEDGSFSFLFGYMNRNWLEEIDVPVGPGNMMSPGPADVGQPTHFLPRRNRFTFKVPVPPDFGPNDEMVWTLTTNGVTEYAFASLRTDYKVDNMVIASETGALGAGSSSPETRSNTAPVLRILGDRELTARVGQPVTLVAEIVDDGLPRSRAAAARARADSIAAARAGESPAPDASAASDGALAEVAAGDTSDEDTAADDAVTDSAEVAAGPMLPPRALRPPSRVTVGKRTGLHLSWFVYRGPDFANADRDVVSFAPIQVKVWEDTRAAANSPWGPLWVAPDVPEDGRYEAQVTFTQPGIYVLRARADDGALYADEDVTINVTTLLP